jgi:hypothetical protein
MTQSGNIQVVISTQPNRKPNETDGFNSIFPGKKDVFSDKKDVFFYTAMNYVIFYVTAMNRPDFFII